MSDASTEIEWLSLSEYANEFGVSVSTLRRRIKSRKMKYKVIHGKYFLPRHHLPPSSQASTPVPASEAIEIGAPGENTTNHPSVDVVTELKSTFKVALQSKEEQIIQLKQQITDLKTLVMYLERENEKYGPGN